MRRDFAIALAAAAIAIAAFGSSASMPAAPRSAAHAAISPLIQEAAIVCGGNGCNVVHTKAQRRRKFQTLGHG